MTESDKYVMYGVLQKLKNAQDGERLELNKIDLTVLVEHLQVVLKKTPAKDAS